MVLVMDLSESNVTPITTGYVKTCDFFFFFFLNVVSNITLEEMRVLESFVLIWVSSRG